MSLCNPDIEAVGATAEFGIKHVKLLKVGQGDKAQREKPGSLHKTLSLVNAGKHDIDGFSMTVY